MREGPDLVYRLTLWRQAKAIADEVALSIAAPAGWEVSSAAVKGGGGGRTVNGDEGVAPTISVLPSSVRVEGTVTADVTVEIRFSRGLVDRLVDWLKQPVA